MPMRPIRVLANAVVALLAAQIVLMVVEGIALLYRLGVLHRLQSNEFVSQAQAQGADNAVGTATSIGGLLFLATVVVWCVWQHRAQHNAAGLTTVSLRFTPGWAVGWWFIPIANLFKPFQGVRELWKASHGGNEWERLATWAVIGWWWAAWLVGNLHIWFGSEEGGFSFGTDTFSAPISLSGLVSHDTWEIVSIGLRVVAALLAVAIVRSVVRLQEAAEPSRFVVMPPGMPPLPAPPSGPPPAPPA